MFGCDMFVVLPPLTKPQGVIFGKNSGRPLGEAQEVIYLQGKSSDNQKVKLKCTNIEIEGCDQKYSVILSKPTWAWGAEMGSNSAGVSIGYTAVKTNDLENSSDKKLLGMDLVRLGLERGGSAEEAMTIIIDFLEKYGQGGSYSNLENCNSCQCNFLIVDCKEAWVLETLGKHWIAEKVKGGYRNISNNISISRNYDKISSDMKTFAIENKLWDGEGDFEFKAIFSAINNSREIAGENLLKENVKDQNFNVENLFSILRNKESGICYSPKSDVGDSAIIAASQVSFLSNSVCVHWFTGTSDPNQSVFKPFIFTENAKISQHTTSIENEDPLLWTLHNSAVSSKLQAIAELRSMEDVCTSEMLNYIGDPVSIVSLELDELFKDIVETEGDLFIH